MILRKFIFNIFFLVLLAQLKAQAIDVQSSSSNSVQTLSPLATAKLIADKLIRETSFKYNLVLQKPNRLFNDVQVIDFGRTFQYDKPAVAYAYTALYVDEPTMFFMQVNNNDGCKIWLNGKMVYSKKSDADIKIEFDERSINMQDSCKLLLNKGVNTLLIKSETKGTNKWQVFIQPPPIKGAIISNEIKYPQIGLKFIDNIDTSIANVSNWLVIGPFKNNLVDNQRTGLDNIYAPERSIDFGNMYEGLNGGVTWTIPKVDILGDVIGAKEWGTPYNWNYHNGGLAWAMENLAEISGEKKYEDYAANFCNFHLNGKPFVEYQVNKLNAFNSANSLFINTPLLDFTLAPALPFIYKLRKDNTDFINKNKYSLFVDTMMQYALYKQLRLPGLNIFTRTTPVKYTTWADDMFMGIPFLVQAALYEKDAKLSKQFMDDAANQLIGFNQQVFDEKANLYVHAHYSNSPIRLPHWSRANGWGIWATTEVLMHLPKADARYQIILKCYQKHVAELAKIQDSTGFWLNVLDRKDSEAEVSGTAIFTMAIARGIRLGWLNEKQYMPMVVKAFAAIKTAVDADGTVHKICVGTMCSEDVNYYLSRPFYDNDTHGLFAVLFAAIEMQQLMDKIN